MPGAWRGAWRRAALLALLAPRCCAGPDEPPPRAAVLLFGLAFRNPRACGPSVTARVTEPLRAEGFAVTVLAHSPRVGELRYSRTAEACTLARDLSAYGADAVELDDQAAIDRAIAADAAGAGAFLARGDHDSERGASGHAVRNALRALWSLRAVTRMAERAAPDAALWVILRADIECARARFAEDARARARRAPRTPPGMGGEARGEAGRR